MDEVITIDNFTSKCPKFAEDDTQKPLYALVDMGRYAFEPNRSNVLSH